ncbi:MAG: c-type cytochrome [Proteobacteria bacterium]|nr:c-type cytochrome [Pseudomonadota bacterium]
MSAGSGEFNKYAMAVLGTLTMVMGLGFFASALVSPKKMVKPGWELPEASAGGGGAAPVAAKVEPIADRLAKADAKKGEAVSKQCHSCHTFESGGATKQGPNLFGIFGKEAGKHAGFAYSAGMAGLGKTWDAELLDQFLANPKGVVAGTKMTFAGVSRPDQRADLIKYIEGLK